MKFKDAYRRTNDSVHVRADLLETIRYRQAKAQIEEAEKQKKRRWWIAIPTAASAAMLAGLAIVVGLRVGQNKDVAATAEQAPSALDSIVEKPILSNAIFDTENSDLYNFETVDSYETLAQRIEERALQSAEYVGDLHNVVATALNEEQTMVEGVVYSLDIEQSCLVVSVQSDEKTTETARVPLEPTEAGEMIVYQKQILSENRLFVIGTAYASEAKNGMHQPNTIILTYTLADRTEPMHIATLRQDGEFESARIADGVLTVISYDSVTVSEERHSPDDLCPHIAVNGQTARLPIADIYINPQSSDNCFTVITAIDAGSGTQFAAHKAVLGGGDLIEEEKQHPYLTP